MLSQNFDVLTPLSKLHRISRSILDNTTFSAGPGQWIALAAKTADNYVDGAVVAASSGDATEIYELCMNYAVPADLVQPTGLGAYEANDTKVGRITTLSEPGIRLQMGEDLLKTGVSIAALSIGDKLAVDAATGLLDVLATGTQQAVVRVMGVGTAFFEAQTIEQIEIVTP